MTNTVTLTQPELDGQWDVEPLGDGRLLLSPHLGPTIAEIEADHGERLQGEEFQRRWGHLPCDGERWPVATDEGCRLRAVFPAGAAPRTSSGGAYVGANVSLGDTPRRPSSRA